MVRPIEYTQTHTDKLLSLRRFGYSVEELAMELDVCVDTLYRWSKSYPEFGYAFDLCRDYAIATLKRSFRENLQDRNYNSRLAELLLGNATRQGCRRGLSKLLEGRNPKEQCDALLLAISDGQIDYERGESLISVVTAGLKAEEIVIIRSELAKLKSSLQGHTTDGVTVAADTGSTS